MATQFGALNIVFYLTLFLQQLISDAAWCRSFDHKPGPNCRGTLFPTRLHLLLGALLILYFIMPAGYRGEGSVFAMEHREALNSLLHNMHPLSAKQHGLGHSAGMCLPETKKRSFRRACRRAMINGCSWYHGKCWTTSDFPPALCTSVAAHVHQHLISLLLSERPPARTRRIHPSADSNFFSGIQVGSVVIVLLNFNCGCSNKRLMLCVSLRPDGRWNLNGFPNIGRAYTQALMLDTMEFFS